MNVQKIDHPARLSPGGPDDATRRIRAADWQPSDDLQTRTLPRRDRVTGHDGDAPTAEAVAWNLRRWSDATPGTFSNFAAAIAQPCPTRSWSDEPSATDRTDGARSILSLRAAYWPVPGLQVDEPSFDDRQGKAFQLAVDNSAGAEIVFAEDADQAKRLPPASGAIVQPRWRPIPAMTRNSVHDLPAHPAVYHRLTKTWVES